MSKLIELGRVSRETRGTFFTENVKLQDANDPVRECVRIADSKTVTIYQSATDDVEPSDYKDCKIL